MDKEEFSAQLIKWLKARRDEFDRDAIAYVWTTLDRLMDDAREAEAVGVLPWELSDGD